MQQTHQFEVGGKLIKSYLALPESGRGPGILVLHAWWGLNDFFKGFCDRLAGEGFVALAPDLYHGAIASTIDEAKHLRKALDRTVTNKEIEGSVEYLCTHSAVSGHQIGVVGFSLGGHLALWSARYKPNDISAVVVFYGTGGGNYAKSQAAFLGHFAETDKWGAGPQSVRKLEERLRSAGREVSFYTYPGTGHWFFEKDRPEAYNAQAAQLAWKRTVEFLRGRLE